MADTGTITNINLSNVGSTANTTGIRLTGVDTYDGLGASVSGAGDVNGDGYDDLIVGARSADPNGDGSGSGSASSRILEGSSVNIDVTSAGATLALGLMYLKTNDAAVAERLAVPDTLFLLDYVRPDLLLLRQMVSDTFGQTREFSCGTCCLPCLFSKCSL